MRKQVTSEGEKNTQLYVCLCLRKFFKHTQRWQKWLLRLGGTVSLWRGKHAACNCGVNAVEKFGEISDGVDDRPAHFRHRHRFPGSHVLEHHEKQRSCGSCSVCPREAVHEHAVSLAERLVVHEREHGRDEHRRGRVRAVDMPPPPSDVEAVVLECALPLVKARDVVRAVDDVRDSVLREHGRVSCCRLISYVDARPCLRVFPDRVERVVARLHTHACAGFCAFVKAQAQPEPSRFGVVVEGATTTAWTTSTWCTGGAR